eukprot:RCo028497
MAMEDIIGFLREVRNTDPRNTGRLLWLFLCFGVLALSSVAGFYSLSRGHWGALLPNLAFAAVQLGVAYRVFIVQLDPANVAGVLPETPGGSGTEFLAMPTAEGGLPHCPEMIPLSVASHNEQVLHSAPSEREKPIRSSSMFVRPVPPAVGSPTTSLPHSRPAESDQE